MDCQWRICRLISLKNEPRVFLEANLEQFIFSILWFKVTQPEILSRLYLDWLLFSSHSKRCVILQLLGPEIWDNHIFAFVFQPGNLCPLCWTAAALWLWRGGVQRRWRRTWEEQTWPQSSACILKRGWEVQRVSSFLTSVTNSFLEAQELFLWK